MRIPNRLRWPTSALAVLLGIVALAAPGGAATATGAVTLVMPEEPRSLASWEAYATHAYPVLRNVQEALLNRDPKTNELVGELALSWDRVTDTTWRFELRQGVKFHDGSPFNAEAAAIGLNYMWDKANNFQIRQFVGPEFTAKAAGEYTLDVTTEAPDPILPARLYFSPLPSAKALQEHPDEYPIKPIGTGPYRFVDWARGQSITIEANPDWWGTTATDSYGKATIQSATFVFRPEGEVRKAMVETGEADFARYLTKEQCESLPGCSGGPGVETVMLRLDTMNPAMADHRVREAIALAIDKDAIMGDIMGGGTVAAQIVGPSALGFDPALEPYPYDPVRATALVAEAAAAGVPVDVPLSVVTRTGWIVRGDESIELIASSLRNIGLTGATSNTMETATAEAMWSAPHPIPPERGILGMWQHGNEVMDYSASLGGYYTCDGVVSAYCNPDVDAAVAAANVLTGVEREAALQAIATTVYEELPIVPIGQPNFYFGLSDKLTWDDRLDGFILLKEMSLK